MDDIFTVLQARLGSIPKNRTIVELGAAGGEDSMRIAEAVGGSNGEIDYIAFEPDQRNSINLSAHVWINVVEAAVGNINGFVPFYASSGHTFSGSVKIPKLHLKVHESIKFDSPHPVRMVRLDDFFSVFRLSGPVDFIWCDIQGAEDLMIEGAQTTLHNTRFFYSECYEQEMYEGQIGRQEILKRLPGEWRIANEWPEDVLFENLRFQ